MGTFFKPGVWWITARCPQDDIDRAPKEGERKARGWRDNEVFVFGDRWRGDKRAVASRHGGPFERGMGMDFYF